MTRPSAVRLSLLAILVAVVAASTACKGEEKPKPAAAPAFQVTSLDTLKSYRYASEIVVSAEALDPKDAQALLQGSGLSVKATGVRVTPDRHQATIAADLGFIKANIETIRIGQEQWSREPQGTWQRGATGAASLLATQDFSPQGLFFGPAGPSAEELTRRLGPRTYSDATVGGVAARQYTFDRQGFEGVFGTQSAVPESAANVTTRAEVWFAKERGVLLRVLITGTTPQQKEVLRVDVQVSDVDAASNTVEPPR